MHDLSPRSASPAWLVGAATALALALIAAATALAHQRAASTPIGEGELFHREAEEAAVALAEGLSRGDDLDETVRRIRNALEIEVVALVDGTGVYTAATSPNLVGRPIGDGFLAFLLSDDRFGAIAKPIAEPVLVDGVEEWAAGDVLYQVLLPIDEGRALSLHYDVSELLARRAGARAIQPLTIQLAGSSATLALTSLLLLWGRSVARRRIRESVLQARHLAERSAELEEHNRRLDEARAEAERALLLAEETNRVRSEFVLMINHELRTPLTSVVTGTELLRGGELGSTEQDALLDDMGRDGDRLMELISNMLVVARIENRGLDYSLRPVEVSQILDGVRRLSHAATVSSEVPEAVATRLVRTDRDGLINVLVSLAENARTHGASSVEVGAADALPGFPDHTVGTMPRSALHFLVRDDGPGFDPGFLPNAFEKFEKDSRSAGTGLGLYVARLMVEAIEGAISVFTGPGGSTLFVSVPLVRAAAEVAA